MSCRVATGPGAKLGVLVRDADALEMLSKITTVGGAETGRLAVGTRRVRTGELAEGIDEDQHLERIAAAEVASEHPLARAVVAHARQAGAASPKAYGGAQPRAIRGKGIAAEVGGHRVLFGTRALLEDEGITVPDAAVDRAEELRRTGATVSFAAVDGRYEATWAIGDTVKPSAREALDGLRMLGIRAIMLTGDAKTTALAVGRELGIPESDVVAQVLPDEKARVVTDLQAKGSVVAMAGDGINDAPALASAHVGIAMGSGTDVAIESAGVTLVKGDLRGIVRAVRLGRATLRNIRQNLVLAFGYNALAIPVAAGLLYPVFGLLLSPMLAAAAMTLSSVSVVLNAVRIRNAL
jgi:Cu+-exporting ATPase